MKVNVIKWMTILILCCFMSNISLSQDVDTGSETLLEQIGDYNAINIIQNQNGAATGNFVRVLQKGVDNSTNVRQSGTKNRTDVVQFGTGNEYNLNVEGDRNYFLIRQDGVRNVINQNLTKAYDNEIVLVQQGNDNEITHNQHGEVKKNILVKQIGDGMKLNITQSEN